MRTKALPLRIASIYALKLLLIALISISWLLIDLHETQACVPGPISRMTPSEKFDKSTRVFSGEAIARYTVYRPDISVDDLRHRQSYNIGYLNVIKVNTIWKGPLYEYMYIWLPTDLSSCGSGPGGLLPGMEHLIYARSDTAINRGVHGLAGAWEHLEELGKGELPIVGLYAPNPWHEDDLITEEALLEQFGECLLPLGLTWHPSSPAATSTGASLPVPETSEAPLIAEFCEEAAAPETGNVGTPGWLVPVRCGGLRAESWLCYWACLARFIGAGDSAAPRTPAGRQKASTGRRARVSATVA